MRTFRWPLVAAALAAALPAAAAAGDSPTLGDERAVQAAGLTADGPTLVGFFRTRGKAEADGAARYRTDRPEQWPAVRALLKDAKPAVRLRAALSLSAAGDAEAVAVLIDLLADLPPEQRKEAEDVLRELAGEWAPGGVTG